VNSYHLCSQVHGCEPGFPPSFQRPRLPRLPNGSLPHFYHAELLRIPAFDLPISPVGWCDSSKLSSALSSSRLSQPARPGPALCRLVRAPGTSSELLGGGTVLDIVVPSNQDVRQDLFMNSSSAEKKGKSLDGTKVQSGWVQF
jgi:hypothetical protein